MQGKLEYPELELVGSISPPMPRAGGGLDGTEEDKGGYEDQLADVESIKEVARVWSDHYRDCVTLSLGSETSLATMSEDSLLWPGRGEKIKFGVEGSSDVRASTLDFKRSLEFDEEIARQALGLGIGERRTERKLNERKLQ